MVKITRLERLSSDLPLAPTAALIGGVLIALSFLVMPVSALERLVGASGIPAVIAAAEPPLGSTARIALGLLLGGGFAGISWFGLELLAGDRNLTIGRAVALFMRGDVHPDAPPRPPLFATRDLGTPFLDVKAPRREAVEETMVSAPVTDEDEDDPILELDRAWWTDREPENQTIPADLDQPLAAYDPGAILDEPLPPTPPVAPLARPSLIDPGDRFETFELTPVTRERPSLREPAPAPVPAPAPAARPVVGAATEASVNDLLARLERGLTFGASAMPAEPLSRPAPQPAAPTLADTLGDLRRLATANR